MINIYFSPFPELKSDRLVLRKLKESDDQLIFDYQSKKENFEFVDMPIYNSLKDARDYIKKMNIGVSNNSYIIWAISDPVTDKIMGTISIWNINENEEKAELGYGLYPGNIGKGIMSEAMQSVLTYGFNKIGLKRIEAYTNILNKKSIKMLESNGFSKVKIIKEKNPVTNNINKMVIYKIVKE